MSSPLTNNQVVRVPNSITTNNRRSKRMMTTILHQLFTRVEIETYKPSWTSSQRLIWGDYSSMEINVHPDDLMDHVLEQKHSFVFPRAEGIRLIRVWDQDGAFVHDYDEFLSAIGIAIESDLDCAPCTDNPYLSKLHSKLPSITSPWTQFALLRMWMDLRSVSIGSGANKEMIEASTYGRLLPEFDIELEKLIDATAKDITKAAKCIGRLLRPFRYFSMEQPSIILEDMEVDAFLDGWTASIDLQYCREVLGVPNVQIGDRLEITALDVQGLLKGHGEVGDHPETNVILYGEQYKRIVRSRGLKWFAVDVLHGSEEAYLDIQSLINLGTRVFPENTLQNWISDTISETVHKTKYTKLPAVLNDVRNLLQEPSRMYADRWSLRRMAVHNLPAMLPVMLRKTYAFHSSSIKKLGNLRIKIPGAIRRYVAPDLSGEVRPGCIIIKGASFFLSKADAPWFMQLHGGADNDDGFVCIPIAGDRVLLYRNPNQIGEWSVMRIQSSDVRFDVINDIQLPIAQRLNWKDDDMTVDKIMDTVASFWKHLVSESVEVERALLHRVPENYRERIRTKDGWITRLFQFADHHLSLANEAVDRYSKEMSIPEELITSPRSPYYEVARELRRFYGHGIRTARTLNEKYSLTSNATVAEVETDLMKRIEKVHGRVRRTLSQFHPDAQKLLIRDLMRICYLELPGMAVGEDDYVLSQANDGILGISSSPNGRSRGTFDVLVDVLVDYGFGHRLHREDDRIVFETVSTPQPYEFEGIAIRVIGGWQSVASLYNDGVFTEDHLISLAYRAVKEADHVLVRSRRLYIQDTEFGRIVSHAHVADGKYKILYPGRPGKSLVMQIAELRT